VETTVIGALRPAIQNDPQRRAALFFFFTGNVGLTAGRTDFREIASSDGEVTKIELKSLKRKR